MGCDPIVLVGLDLVLEDGKQYTDGCGGWTRSQGKLEVEGYYGDKVETIATYNTFRDQFNLDLPTARFSADSLHQFHWRGGALESRGLNISVYKK